MSHVLRVLLVDDEYLAIEDLLSMINWEENGFEIVGTARSGKQALKLLSEKPVDLVVTDISMPGMDGITLVEEARKQYPDLIFLLLTAYVEIEYMKKAFQQGVEDYLIKDEITSQLLTQKLNKVRTKMLSHRVETYSHLQKLFQEYFCSSTSVIPPSLSCYGSRIFFYCIVTPDILYPMASFTDNLIIDHPYTTLTIIQSALSRVEEFNYPGLDQFCSFLAFNNKIILLLDMTSSVSVSQTLNMLQQFGSALLKFLKQTLPYSYSFFYSPFPISLEEIHADYFQRQTSLRGRYFMKGNQVLSISTPLLSVSNSKIDLKEDMLVQFYQDTPDQLPDFLNHQLQTIISERNYTGLFTFIQVCFAFLEHRLPGFGQNPAYRDYTDLPSLSAFINKQFELLIEKDKNNLSHDIRQAITYIAEHCHNPELSLQEIADHVSLSVTHFSRMFKSETGDTVGDYITSYRMQKACRLLKETNQKIYEISEAAGYSSPQYFSQVFVKQFGIKPLDYRKKNRI